MRARCEATRRISRRSSAWRTCRRSRRSPASTCRAPDRGFDKDGIDLTVLQRGALGLTTSTRLDLQIKSYSGDARGDPWPFDLPVKSYTELIATEYQVPRILVVVRVPAEVGDWLAHGEEQLVLRRCGYWRSFHGGPPTENASTIRIRDPQGQPLRSVCAIVPHAAGGRGGPAVTSAEEAAP